MDASDLQTFETVARLGGMGRAAAELNTVQSNVSTRVRCLEEELGTPLFHRHARGVRLTNAGRRLLPYAARVGQLLGEARRAVADDGTPRGPLAVGALETTAALRLPPILSAFTSAYPEVELTLTTGTTSELVAAVLDRRLEAAFVTGPVRGPELDEETVFREELVVVTAPSVRRLDDLVQASGLKIVVFRAGCSCRQRLEAILADRGAVCVKRLEFATLGGIVGCVAAGMGVTLLPRNLVEPARREGVVAIHGLPPEQSRVDTVFIRRRDTYVSSALEAFLRCTRPPRRAAARATKAAPGAARLERRAASLF